MKNLAQCTPTEFLVQTNKIRHAVEKWLTVTDIMNIRKRKPMDLPVAMPGVSEAENREVLKQREAMMAEQAKRNMTAILNAILEEHPQETLEVLALCCFVEPEDVDNHTVSEYLGAVFDMVEDENVMRFFTLLAQLEQKNIFSA